MMSDFAPEKQLEKIIDDYLDENPQLIKNRRAVEIELQGTKLKSAVSDENIGLIRKKVSEAYDSHEFFEAVVQYYKLSVLGKLSTEDKKNFAFFLLDNNKIADSTVYFEDYLKDDSIAIQDKNSTLKLLGNLYCNFPIKNLRKAIYCFEECIKTETNDFELYNSLGFLYSVYFKDKFLDKQSEYLSIAYKLAPNNSLVIRNLAELYIKLGNKEKAEKLYQKLFILDLNPSDYFDYGAFLISQGNFKDGFRYHASRIDISDNPTGYPQFLRQYPKWDGSADLRNKTLLIHCEQGYGDSLMFMRFIPELKLRVKKIIFVVQHNLVSLLKAQAPDYEVISDRINLKLLDFDYHIPLMDLPMVLCTIPKSIPTTGGYLTLPQKDIDKYSKEYVLNNNKYKIGIAYHGNENSPYKDRDISLKEFLPLINSNKFQVYSFQVNTNKIEDNNFPQNNKIIDLSKTFFDFYDTACAVKCMDAIITIDCVMLHLAGALGVKTYGLFNKYPAYRWYKTQGNNVGWYSTVKPYKADSCDEWTPLIKDIIKDLKNNK